MEREEQILQIDLEYKDIKQVLDERSIRWWCASKSRAYNRIHRKGGVSIVSEATGISRSRIQRGLKELALSNEGFVNVGISCDTARFAVNSIRKWWNKKGTTIYQASPSILITADGGGSNGSRVRLCIQGIPFI